MPVDLNAALAVVSSEQYSSLQGVEYLFHESLQQGKLEDLLRKFPNYQVVQTLMDEEVLQFQPLEDGWQGKLLTEVNSLIELLPSVTITALSNIVEGKVDYDTDEMFEFRANLSRWFRKNSVEPIEAHQRGFLDDFFYGIDFSHWTKWAVLVNYANTDLKLPTILRARRNGVDFAIDGNQLVYAVP